MIKKNGACWCQMQRIYRIEWCVLASGFYPRYPCPCKDILTRLETLVNDWEMSFWYTLNRSNIVIVKSLFTTPRRPYDRVRLGNFFHSVVSTCFELVSSALLQQN